MQVHFSIQCIAWFLFFWLRLLYLNYVGSFKKKNKDKITMFKFSSGMHGEDIFVSCCYNTPILFFYFIYFYKLDWIGSASLFLLLKFSFRTFLLSYFYHFERPKSGLGTSPLLTKYIQIKKKWICASCGRLWTYLL